MTNQTRIFLLLTGIAVVITLIVALIFYASNIFSYFQQVHDHRKTNARRATGTLTDLD